MIDLEDKNASSETSFTYSQIIDMLQDQPLEVQKTVVSRIMPLLSSDMNDLLQPIWLITGYLFFIAGVSFAQGGALTTGLKQAKPLLENTLSDMKLRHMLLKQKIGTRYDPALEPAIENLEAIVKQMLTLIQGYVDGRFHKPDLLRETTSKLIARLGINIDNLPDVLKSHAGRKNERTNDSLYRVCLRLVEIHGRRWKTISDHLYQELMRADISQLDEDQKAIRQAWKGTTREYRIEQLRKTFNARSGKK